MVEPAGAATSEDLSTKVLAQVPVPGMIPTAPGPTNGPIGPSNIGSFGGSQGAYAEAIASGDVVGYIRAFAHDPANGQAVVIEGDWVKDQSTIPTVLAGVEGAAKGPRFSVPGLVDAIGFETTSPAAPGTQYVVAFARGNYVFLTLAGSTDGSLGKSVAVSVASAQAAVLPGAPTAAATGWFSGNASYEAGEVLGAVLLAAAVIATALIAVRKLRGGNKRTTPTPAATSAAWSVRYAVTPMAVGWHQTGTDYNEQFYWDGGAWTASRHWRAGSGWTEIPLLQTSGV